MSGQSPATHPQPPPPAFVHVDVDALWAVRQCYGDAEAQPANDDPVYREGVPALAELFARLKVPASFFAVGRDAALPGPAARLGELARAGHEIENHSWSHSLGLSDLSDDALAEEIDRAAEAIAAATGSRPQGFRAPGYDASPRLGRFLGERGYLYDSSVLPTWAGPLLRLADARLRGTWRTKRRQYGSWRAAFAPLAPCEPAFDNPWRARNPQDGRLALGMLELPPLVSPRTRLPIHAGFAALRGISALEKALDAAERHLGPAEPILFLMHGIDATDARDERHPIPGGRGKRFFAASAEEKLRGLEAMLRAIQARRVIVPTRPWVRARLAREAKEATGRRNSSQTERA